jgi:hypothetical protein
MDALPEHSPLGASSAERWMTCPGSVKASEGWVDEESDFAAEGTVAHTLGADCLENDIEPWRLIGEKPDDRHDIAVTKEMADAVSVYVSFIRDNLIEPSRRVSNQKNYWIERRFHCPTIHPLFFGTSDAAGLIDKRKLLVVDYKHGAGIVVDAEDNAQLMYYACGVLETENLWDEVDEVEVVIVQPRAFHFDGPIRRWTLSTDALAEWLEDKLIPAMKLAEVSRHTKSGEHCRFCPARFGACPSLMSDIKELEELMEKIGKDASGVSLLTNKQIGRFLDLGETFKIVRTAALKTATVRVGKGEKVPGWKLAKARSNREFKEGAEEAAKKTFGQKAYTEPSLKSPAEIDGLPGGEAFTKRWAFKPDKGETLTQEGDARPSVSKQTKTMFTGIQNMKKKST